MELKKEINQLESKLQVGEKRIFLSIAYTYLAMSLLPSYLAEIKITTFLSSTHLSHIFTTYQISSETIGSGGSGLPAPDHHIKGQSFGWLVC